MAVTEPFDRGLPSPISQVLDLRSSARASVVLVERELTGIQERQWIRTDLEHRILDAIHQRRPGLAVISGSPGGGKSLLLRILKTEAGAEFDSIIEDATHSDSPTRDQYEVLLDVIEPFADGSAPYAGKTRLVAMNTGMVVTLFDQLNRSEHRGRFSALEGELKGRLGLPVGAGARPHLRAEVLVVNLDQRPTSGLGGLFERMLEALDPAGGALIDNRRCAGCQVRGHCFVRSNAAIVSSGPARAVLSTATDQIALKRGRPIAPRALWDLASDLLTGGHPFDESGDPCDAIAAMAATGAEARVLERILPNGIFYEGGPGGVGEPFAGRLGDTASALRELDVTFTPLARVHDVMTGAGVDPAADGNRLAALLGGAESPREAVQIAAAGLTSVLAGDDDRMRAPAGRALARAEWLGGSPGFELPPVDADFELALAELAVGPGPHLEGLRHLVGASLTALAGTSVGPKAYFRTEAYDPRRRWSIMVEVDLETDTDRLSDGFDPVTGANPEGASLVGYRPMSVTFIVNGRVPVVVDLGLYQLLKSVEVGMEPASADPARTYALRLAAESLGRLAATDHRLPLLLENRADGSRYQLFHRGAGRQLGGRVLS